jgi:hypothetical protein
MKRAMLALVILPLIAACDNPLDQPEPAQAPDVYVNVPTNYPASDTTIDIRVNGNDNQVIVGNPTAYQDNDRVPAEEPEPEDQETP